MWTLTQTTSLDATEPSAIKSISLSNSHVSQNRESEYKGNLEGKYRWRKFTESFWDSRHEGLSRKKKKRLPRNPGKEVIAVVSFITPSNLEVSITAYRLLHGRRTFALGVSQSTAAVSLEYCVNVL